MNIYPYPSLTDLTKLFLETCASLSTDRNRVLPPWALDSPNEIFGRRKFIVCGSVCQAEIEVLARNAEVVAIVDDFLSRDKSELYGIPLIDTDTWVDRARKDGNIVSCILVWGPRAFQHFNRQCIQWQLPFLDPLQFIHLIKLCGLDTSGEYGRFFMYGHAFLDETLEHADQLLRRSEILEDHFSKISWLCVLLYRVTLNPYFLEACAVGHGLERFGLNSYAINRQFLRFSDEEVYVDGGAFVGDTIEYFLRAVGGKFKRIYSFEPSSSNTSTIRARLDGLRDLYPGIISDRIELVEKGLWNSERVLRFNPCQAVLKNGSKPFGPQSAHILDTGFIEHLQLYDSEQERQLSIDVPVTTIDGATDETATFIKLEVEGSELMALEGASATIQRNRPKMALSIYHKPEDLITITDFVLETGMNYRLGFRQHNPLCPDAMVLYCYH